MHIFEYDKLWGPSQRVVTLFQHTKAFSAVAPYSVVFQVAQLTYNFLFYSTNPKSKRDFGFVEYVIFKLHGDQRDVSLYRYDGDGDDVDVVFQLFPHVDFWCEYLPTLCNSEF